MRKLADFARRAPQDVLLYNCTGTDPQSAQRVLRTTADLPLEFREACIREAQALGHDPMTTVATLDFQTYLVSILNRQDKMSMATSLEARVPFLDNEMIDFARSLPLRYRQTLMHRKRVLKDVALRYLPAQIVRRRKSGFGVPLRQWFAGRGPLSALLDQALADKESRALLHGEAIDELARTHRHGGQDHSELLWGILNLHLWRKRFAV